MKPVFDLTFTHLNAMVLRLASNDWQGATAWLNANNLPYQQFQNIPLILDISVLQPNDASSLTVFVAQLLKKGLRPIALQHCSQDWHKEAAALKLWFQNGNKHPEKQIQSQADIVIQDNVIHITNITPYENNLALVVSNPNPINTPPNARRTMVIDAPVRTGQQVYAQDADLIVLGMVSEGAEIIADGNIHVYAPMRGRALAGEKGDTSARIFMQSMQAELVSIAGVYRVFEQDLPPHLNKQAVRVELVEDRLLVGAIHAQ